jgi:hypothetical protein
MLKQDSASTRRRPRIPSQLNLSKIKTARSAKPAPSGEGREFYASINGKSSAEDISVTRQRKLPKSQI